MPLINRADLARGLHAECARQDAIEDAAAEAERNDGTGGCRCRWDVRPV